MALDLDGVMVSAGAACSSGKVKASQVLDGHGRRTAAPARPSASAAAGRRREDDWARFAEAWLAAYARHRARRARAAA